MRRSPPVLLLVACLALAAPARALETAVGSVIAPSQPAVVRTLYNAGVTTNLVGVVVPIPASADGSTYTLTRTSGLGNLDAYFYAAGPGGTIGDICYVTGDDDGLNPTTETGTICAGPQTVAYGVIVLRWGANAGFTFAY